MLKRHTRRKTRMSGDVGTLCHMIIIALVCCFMFHTLVAILNDSSGMDWVKINSAVELEWHIIAYRAPVGAKKKRRWGNRAPVGAKKKRRWGRGSSEGSKKFLLGFVRRRGWEWQKSNGEGFSSGQ